MFCVNQDISLCGESDKSMSQSSDINPRGVNLHEQRVENVLRKVDIKGPQRSRVSKLTIF